jgi:RsiW-degrading membrane proteinase PrsW (M82 family)
MSLTSLARRHAARTPASRTLLTTSAPAAGSTAADNRAKAFETLGRYVPTEIVTVFTAAIAAIATIDPTANPAQHQLREVLPWVAYGVGAALTPTIYFLIALAKQREAERQAGTPPQAFRPHLWPPTAALIAFLVWAFSITGFIALEQMKTLDAVVAFAAIFVSSLLSLVDRALGLPSPE